MIRRAWRAFIGGCRAEARGWRVGAAIIADVQAKAPAPGAVPPRVPGPDPVPGQQRATPAPDCGPVQAGVGFNRDGCMFTWEPGQGCWKHAQHRLPFNVDEWEARLP